jgi:hypothetical protein
MPFTPSHVAAVLPFARTPLLPAGLAIGAMMPDLFYYVPIDIPRSFAHSWLGVVTVDLAFGIALFLAWQLVFRAPVFDFFPEWVRARIKARDRMPRALPTILTFAGLLIASLLLGSTTHVLWDSFTHAGPTVDALGLGVATGPLPIYKWLQHASTVVGALALVGFVLWWRRRTRPGDAAPTRLTRRTRVGGWLIVAATGLAVSVYLWFRGMSHGYGPFANDLIFYVVTVGLAAAALSAVVLCLIWLFLPVRAYSDRITATTLPRISA